jgi:rubrerythrin
MKKCGIRKEVAIAIHEEIHAATDYGKMATQARRAGDLKAAKLFKHIQKEEIVHKKELRKLK